MTDSNEFNPLDLLVIRQIHDELVKEGFKCKYDQVMVKERKIWSAPKEDQDDWGNTEFNDDWSINKKNSSVFEKREEVSVEKEKSCFELLAEYASFYEQYTAFANGWNYSIEMVDHIEEEIDKIMFRLRLLKEDCPIIQKIESNRKGQNIDENSKLSIKELFEKRKKETQPKRSDDDWGLIREI